MVRTKQTARKSTGLKAPRQQFCTRRKISVGCAIEFIPDSDSDSDASSDGSIEDEQPSPIEVRTDISSTLEIPYWSYLEPKINLLSSTLKHFKAMNNAPTPVELASFQGWKGSVAALPNLKCMMLSSIWAK